MLTLVPLGFGNHGFMAEAVKLLLDEVEPLGHASTTARYHRAMVVDSRHSDGSYWVMCLDAKERK